MNLFLGLEFFQSFSRFLLSFNLLFLILNLAAYRAFVLPELLRYTQHSFCSCEQTISYCNEQLNEIYKYEIF